MDFNSKKPMHAEPVARAMVSNKDDLLNELGEETLAGVAPSISVTLPCGISGTAGCSFAGDAE